VLERAKQDKAHAKVTAKNPKETRTSSTLNRGDISRTYLDDQSKRTTIVWLEEENVSSIFIQNP